MSKFVIGDQVLVNPNQEFVSYLNEKLKPKDLVKFNKSQGRFKPGIIFMIVSTKIKNGKKINNMITQRGEYICSSHRPSSWAKYSNNIKFYKFRESIPSEDEFRYLLENREETGDFTLTLGADQFKVHKWLLITRSSFFRGLFGSMESSEKRDNSINLQEEYFSKTSIEYFITYIYLQKMPPTENLSENDLYKLISTFDFCGLNQIRNLLMEDFITNLNKNTLNLWEIRNEYIKTKENYLNSQKLLELQKNEYQNIKSKFEEKVKQNELKIENQKRNDSDNQSQEDDNSSESSSNDKSQEDDNSSESYSNNNSSEDSQSINQLSDDCESARRQLIKLEKNFNELSEKFRIIKKDFDQNLSDVRKYSLAFFYAYDLCQLPDVKKEYLDQVFVGHKHLFSEVIDIIVEEASQDIIKELMKRLVYD